MLFLYSNPIRLIGAAWVPWGFCAIDRLLRQGRRRGGIELAVILRSRSSVATPRTPT